MIGAFWPRAAGGLSGPRLVMLPLGLLCLLAVILLLQDPFGSKARRIERLERQAEAARRHATARVFEAEGGSKLARDVERVVGRQRQLERSTTATVVAAKAAADASELLGPERAERLRSHDQSICQMAQLKGCEEDAP